MSDNESVEQGTVESNSQEGTQEQTDFKAIVDKLTAERDALTGKVNELLGEAKKAKAARRDAEAQAAEEARKKAEADGNYQQLFESSEKERSTLQQQLEEMRSNIAKEKVSVEAGRLAAKLAEGENVELLSEFVQRRLKYTDEGIKVTDSNGNLTVSTIDDLAKEFEGSARYASLLKGNKSSGGGASGGAGSGGAAKKTMPRSQFEALDTNARMQFVKSGGRPVND
jgi:chromosome segregation ATPase